MSTFYRTPYLNRPVDKGEKTIGPSLTVPDQSLSLRTIIERYSRGLPVNAPMAIPQTDKEPDDFDDYIPNFKTLDHAEVHDLMLAARNEVQEIKQRLNKEAADARKAKADREGQLAKAFKYLEAMEKAENQKAQDEAKNGV